MKRSYFLRVAAMLLCLAGTTTAARAQSYMVGDPMPTVTLSQASFADLSSRIEALEAEIKDGKDGKGKDGWEDTSSEKFTLEMGGRIMMDYVNFADQNAESIAIVPDAQDYFEFRRIRLEAGGDGFGVFRYKFEVDFEPEARYDDEIGNSVALKDVYIGVKDVPLLGLVLIGHQKENFSLEEMTSSRYITFMERSLPNIFAPVRRVGIQSYNYSKGENLIWAYGLFMNENIDILHETDVADQAIGENMGLDLVGRLVWLPYYDEPSNGRYLIHTGIAGVYRDDHNDRVRWRARPEVHEGNRWIDTRNLLASEYYTIGLEGAAVWGPLSFQSEFMYTDVSNPVDGAGAPLNDDYYGAYAYVSYFLTGESRAYRRNQGRFDRVKPLENFWVVPGCVGTGAWEVAARWSYLDLSGPAGAQDALPGQQNNFTFGTNWYWNPNMRWMFNYIHSWNKYENRAGIAENDIIAIRGQVDW